MSFGLDNLGVINEQNSPAIWNSTFANFPTNSIAGRLLVANNTRRIYLDLTTGAVNRVLLSDGFATPISAANGLNNITDPTVIELGGAIAQTTNINTENGVIDFEGGTEIFEIGEDGVPYRNGEPLYATSDGSGTTMVYNAPVAAVNLGGSLNEDADIRLNSQAFILRGSVSVFEVSATGRPILDGVAIPSAAVLSPSAVVPTKRLQLTVNGTTFIVAAQ